MPTLFERADRSWEVLSIKRQDFLDFIRGTEIADWFRRVSLNKMEVAKKDRFGQLLKKSELANLSVISAPKAVEAVALVNDEPKQKAGNSPKRFKL